MFARFRPWLPLIALAGTGCISTSFGTVQTANTLGRGKVQVAFEPAVEAKLGVNSGLSGSGAIDVRVGAGESLDVNVRVGISGVELGGKYQFTDKATPSKVLSIAPSFGGFYFGQAAGRASLSLYGQIPVLFGLQVGEGSQLIFGPKLHGWYTSGVPTFGFPVVASSAPAFALSLGSSVGFSAKVSDSVRVLPEFTFLYPVVGTSPLNDRGTDLLAQFSRGVLLGGD